MSDIQPLERDHIQLEAVRASRRLQRHVDHRTEAQARLRDVQDRRNTRSSRDSGLDERDEIQGEEIEQVSLSKYRNCSSDPRISALTRPIR